MEFDDDEALNEYAEPQWSIVDELRWTLTCWKRTHNTFWGIGSPTRPAHIGTDEAWEALQESDRMGGVMSKIALTCDLYGGRHVHDASPMAHEFLKQLREILRKHSAVDAARGRLSLDLAAAALQHLDGAGQRAQRVLSIMHPGGSVSRRSQYLERASRLYIWGMEPECAILCRSALEAALGEALHVHVHEDGRTPPLSELLEIAAEKNILSQRFADPTGRYRWRIAKDTPLWHAERVRVTGNYVAHEFPVVGAEEKHATDAFNALRSLSRVLDALFAA